jgi:peptidoglycan hydrolase CwlO-like protein
MFDPFKEAEKAGTTPFDAPSEEPQPIVTQTNTVPLATSILAPTPSNDQMSSKLAAAEEKISLLDREKQRIQNDHEALLRAREDTERQLEEQKKTVETQKKRYADMEVWCSVW